MPPLSFSAMQRPCIPGQYVHPSSCLDQLAMLFICAAIVLFDSRQAAAAYPSPSPRLPEIRMHRHNGVPACVTPDRLMAFLKMRNGQLDPRYRDIARWYRQHGEAWLVRWDFAFFQMALETNFLTYRRANGEPGDVRAAQNNFAGIGATGGGVAGDRFPDVGTGVLAQIQHLVAYSGEPVERPVAPRTALKQNDIVATMRRLNRPPRFSDLARRWAADPRYASSIAYIAESYQRTFCDAPARTSPSRGDVSSTTPPPAPSPAAKARGKLVARTIWRRGDARPHETAMMPPMPPLPRPAPPASDPPVTASGVADQKYGLLWRLQSVARSMHHNISQWPQTPQTQPAIIAPPPKLADRVPKLASRQ